MDHFGWYRSWWGVTVLKVRLGYHFCIIRSWRVPILKVRPQRHFCINNPASDGDWKWVVITVFVRTLPRWFYFHFQNWSVQKLLSQSANHCLYPHCTWQVDGWEGGWGHAWVSASFFLLLSHAICGWCVSETDPRWSVGACMTVRACLFIFLTAICGCCISETDLWSWNWWYGWGGRGGGEKGRRLKSVWAALCTRQVLHGVSQLVLLETDLIAVACSVSFVNQKSDVLSISFQRIKKCYLSACT